MKGLGLFALSVLALMATALLMFACIHYRPAGWFCLLVVPVVVVAFFTPATCYGYSSRNERDLMSGIEMSHERLDTCRQFGYAVASTLYLFCYAIPVLVWYNSVSFTVYGVLVMDACMTCALVAFALWVRIFLF